MRRCSLNSRIALLLALSATLVTHVSVATACELCGPPRPTLAEQLAQADAVAQARWLGTEKAKSAGALGRTNFEIVQVVRDVEKKLRVRDRVAVVGNVPGAKGDLFLLVGRKAETLEWDSPQKVTEASFKYIVEAPALDAAPAQRLAYFLKFLENPDTFVANDAFAEFVRAPFEDISALTDQLPREKLRRWLTDSKVQPSRCGLYGLMLGLCGDASDAKLLEEIIAKPVKVTRPGIEGVIGGYLLLTGETGLKMIERTKFQDESLLISEPYSAFQAVRFLWTHGGDKFSKTRLQQSVRLLLERPQFAELVIADLARWKDWSAMPKLMTMYRIGDSDARYTNRAIVRYLLTCANDQSSSAKEPKNQPQADLPHVAEARENLAMLREKDPQTVTQAERFFQPARIGIKSR